LSNVPWFLVVFICFIIWTLTFVKASNFTCTKILSLSDWSYSDRWHSCTRWKYGILYKYHLVTEW
jgi:hypothetical protein